MAQAIYRVADGKAGAYAATILQFEPNGAERFLWSLHKQQSRELAARLQRVVGPARYKYDSMHAYDTVTQRGYILMPNLIIEDNYHPGICTISRYTPQTLHILISRGILLPMEATQHIRDHLQWRNNHINYNIHGEFAPVPLL